MSITLKQFIQDNPDDDLATIQSHTVTTVTNEVSSGKARSYLITIGKWAELRTIQQDLTHQLFPLADGIIGVINESAYFGLDPTTNVGQANLGGMQLLVDVGFLTQVQADAFIAMGSTIETPFSDVTQAQIDAYKTATTINLPWANQSKLRITLNTDLYEPSNCILFYSDDFLTNENVGRPKRLHKAGNYEIDLRGVQKTGTLHINFNINADATCELV